MVHPDIDAAWLREQASLQRFPRSAGYDPAWMVDGCMGPNAVWLAEWLTERMDLGPGMRVLDLGCGAALTSIFLAREYGASVVAADLWVKPTENWARIVDAGCSGSVLPLHAEAHDLKFADEYFDAIVSVDAYHYFGTDDLYIGYISQFLRPGGQLGVVVPALTAELDDVPAALQPHWNWDFAAFHSAQWWHRSWTRTGRVSVDVADDDPDGWRHWLRWAELCAAASDSEWMRQMMARDADLVRTDAGHTLTFARIVARRPVAS